MEYQNLRVDFKDLDLSPQNRSLAQNTLERIFQKCPSNSTFHALFERHGSGYRCSISVIALNWAMAVSAHAGTIAVLMRKLELKSARNLESWRKDRFRSLQRTDSRPFLSQAS